MGIVIRQSIITTIISYCGVVIGYVNLLYFYPKFLSQADVALFRIIKVRNGRNSFFLIYNLSYF